MVLTLSYATNGFLVALAAVLGDPRSLSKQGWHKFEMACPSSTRPRVARVGDLAPAATIRIESATQRKGSFDPFTFGPPSSVLLHATGCAKLGLEI